LIYRTNEMKINLSKYQIDNLNILIRLIKSDEKIKKWFDGLQKMPSNLRMNAIMQLTTEMRHQQEDNDIIGAICTLCSNEMYSAVLEAVNEI
jgi:hypothetical protein